MNIELKTLQEADAMHHLHPFNDNGKLAKNGVRIIHRGEGVYVYDLQGKKYLDAFAGLWCVNIGYGRKRIAEAAALQIEQLCYYNTFFQTSSEPTSLLAQKIAELLPGDLNHVFFTNSGSEANDTIVRLIRHFWAVQGKEQKNIFIGRYNGYHGSTLAGASLGGMKSMHEQGDLPIKNILHIEAPFWFLDGGDSSADEYGLKMAKKLEEKILQIGPEKIAAFIGEPIMGAIGVHIPPKTYWPQIKRICQKYDILLVSDEVVCGFGRTGKGFGYETFDFMPDVVTLAKGLTSGYFPMGAAVFNDRIATVLKSTAGELAHGFTYSGHPVGARIAMENINIMQEENLIGCNQDDTACYLKQCWEALGKHRLVGEARIEGMIGALELVPNKNVRKTFEKRGLVGGYCRDRALNNGLILRVTNDAMLLCPPLIIDRQQIDELYKKTWKSLEETAEHFSI